MSHKRVSSLLFILLVIISVVLFHSEAKHSSVEDWTPIRNIKESGVVKTAKFAVAQHNKNSKKNLKYDRVVTGKTQEILRQGMKYDLVISASDGAAARPKNYHAMVWVTKSWFRITRRLIGFVEII